MVPKYDWKMKRTIPRIAALLLVMAVLPNETEAQGFLKKLKERAEQAVTNTLRAPAEAASTTEQHATPEAAPAPEEEPFATVSASDRVPKLRQSKVVWYDEVRPSQATDARALLAELPPLPSVAEVVASNDDSRSAYNNRLAAISMRVDELDDLYSCSDEEMLAARNKMNDEIADALGVSPDLVRKLDDPNTTPSERAAIEEQIKNAALGGFNQEAFANDAATMQARLNQIMEEVKPYEKKMEAGTLTPEDEAFLRPRLAEIQQIQQQLMSGLSGVMNTSAKMDAIVRKADADQQRIDRELKAFSEKVEAVRKNEVGVVKSCEEIEAEYAARLQAIYDKVHQSNSATEVHRLYDEADALMKNYRMRAAQIFLAGLQVRLDNAKKLLPEAERIYGALADNQTIPACVVRRVPLNIVIECVDILDEAYTSFPNPTVLPVKMEQISLLDPDDDLLTTESQIVGGFVAGGDLAESFRNKSHLLVRNRKDGYYYELQGTSRRRLEGDGPFNFFDAKQVQAQPDELFGEIPLRGGGRKAHYSKSGTLTLHDGTLFWPLAVQRHADRLEFIICEYDYETQVQHFVKCTYKL